MATKLTRKQKAQCQEWQHTRWDAFVEHIHQEKTTGNRHLDNVFDVFPHANTYGWYVVDKFKLVALIPLQNTTHSYYALKGHGVAFLANETNTPLHERFVFDSERVYMNGVIPKLKQAYQAHLEANPVVVFFRGSDDGHVGMRLTSEQDARHFIDMLTSFDDVFDFDKNPKALNNNILAMDQVDQQTRELSMTLCYHN